MLPTWQNAGESYGAIKTSKAEMDGSQEDSYWCDGAGSEGSDLDATARMLNMPGVAGSAARLVFSILRKLDEQIEFCYTIRGAEIFLIS
jgi:hypothetical protein